MTARIATFWPPESVTISGEIALEALSVLDAYAEMLAEFRLDGEPDPFFNINDQVWTSLAGMLGYNGHDYFPAPLWDAMKSRSDTLQDQIRSHLDGPALGALAATKMAHDLTEVRARLEYARV